MSTIVSGARGNGQLLIGVGRGRLVLYDFGRNNFTQQNLKIPGGGDVVNAGNAAGLDHDPVSDRQAMKVAQPGGVQTCMRMSARNLLRLAPLAATLAVSILPACGQVPGASVGTNRFNEKAVKQWTLTGPLGESPKRISDNLPLSDQQNRGGWVKFEAMWDEFEDAGLDTNKWILGMTAWRGRQPAWFNPTNVTVRGGQLHLTMRKEGVPKELEKSGYHDYTSAALHTRARSSFGYYEVKARPMNSGGSSSFWFTEEDRRANPGWSTEVDVFELCGKNPAKDRRYHMTVHVWQTPQEKRHWQVGGFWEAPTRFAEDFHVFGFEWGRDELRWYVDGVLVHTVQNTHWHQPLFLIFDSETMPEWFGMPQDADLPSTFSIEYVRAWRGKDSSP